MSGRKIAPQNIMYDRRVVRGNTFAALVIPVSKHSQSVHSLTIPSRYATRPLTHREVTARRYDSPNAQRSDEGKNFGQLLTFAEKAGGHDDGRSSNGR